MIIWRRAAQCRHCTGILQVSVHGSPLFSLNTYFFLQSYILTVVTLMTLHSSPPFLSQMPFFFCSAHRWQLKNNPLTFDHVRWFSPCQDLVRSLNNYTACNLEITIENQLFFSLHFAYLPPLTTIQHLQMIQNAAAWLFNIPEFSHTTQLPSSMHCFSVVAQIRFKTLMIANIVKNRPAPSYLKCS